MNKIILIGRLTRDPETRYSTTGNGEQMAISHYCLAVDRPGRTEGQQNADFIDVVAFGKNGEFAEKYLRQGVKVAVEGRVQTGSYTDKDGTKRKSWDVVVERHEFCEKKGAQQPQDQQPTPQEAPVDGFMNIPEDIENDLPFKG